MALKRTAAKNARKTFSPTTEKRETYPKPGVNAGTTAKKATGSGISLKSTGRKTTTTPVTKGKYGSGGAAINKGFTAPSTTEKRESYGASRYQAAVKNATAAKNTATKRTALKAGTLTNNAPRKAALKGTLTNNAPNTGFSMGETTEARTSYGSTRPKSSATRAKKLY